MKSADNRFLITQNVRRPKQRVIFYTLYNMNKRYASFNISCCQNMFNVFLSTVGPDITVFQTERMNPQLPLSFISASSLPYHYIRYITVCYIAASDSDVLSSSKFVMETSHVFITVRLSYSFELRSMLQENVIGTEIVK